MFVVHILITANERGEDGETVLGDPAFAGGGEAAADFRVRFLLRQRNKLGAQRSRHEVVITQQPDGPMADEWVRVVERVLSEPRVETPTVVDGPETFERKLAVAFNHKTARKSVV